MTVNKNKKSTKTKDEILFSSIRKNGISTKEAKKSGIKTLSVRFIREVPNRKTINIQLPETMFTEESLSLYHNNKRTPLFKELFSSENANLEDFTNFSIKFQKGHPDYIVTYQNKQIHLEELCQGVFDIDKEIWIDNYKPKCYWKMYTNSKFEIPEKEQKIHKNITQEGFEKFIHILIEEQGFSDLHKVKSGYMWNNTLCIGSAKNGLYSVLKGNYTNIDPKYKNGKLTPNWRQICKLYDDNSSECIRKILYFYTQYYLPCECYKETRDLIKKFTEGGIRYLVKNKVPKVIIQEVTGFSEKRIKRIITEVKK